MRDGLIEYNQLHLLPQLPSINQTNTTKHLSSLSITQMQDKSEFNIEQYKLRQQCTYFQYGEITISQEAFCCEVCDPNKTEMICHECMINCHKTCTKDEMKVDEMKVDDNTKQDDMKDLKKKDHMFFICECGKKKHEILRKSDVDLEKRCLFNEFNINMLIKYRYNCKTCKSNNICYICYMTCHQKRNGCQSERIPLKNRRMYQGDIGPCDCTTATHSNVITLTQIVNQMIDKEEYEDVKYIWKLQIFNSFCMTQMSGLLFNQMSLVLQDFTHDPISNKNLLNQCDKFVRLSKCIFRSQKYFYYREAFIRRYPHDKMINVITSFHKDYEKYGNFICSLCFFFYFFHLKKDFQNVKGFCIIDSLISSPLDRILFMKVIHSKNIYNLGLYEKYFNKEKGGNNNNNLDQICIKLLKVLQLSIKEFTVKSLIKCFKNYFTILKIVFFCLKRFVFDIASLTLLIDHFIAISTDIYHFMDESMNSGNKNRMEVINFLKTVMIYITKINCAIVVNYNDLIINERLFNNNDTKHFVHLSSETTKKIARIIIITSVAYGEFIINNNEANKEYKEYLVLLNHLLDMLMLTNNVYYKRFNEVSYEDFRDFYVMWKTIDNLSLWVNKVDYCDSNILEQDNEMIINDKESYIPKKIKEDESNNMTSCEDVLRRNVFNMKEEIEMCYEMFFHYQKKFETIADDIQLLLTNFCLKDRNIFDDKRKIDNKDNSINDKETKCKGSFNAKLKARKLYKYNKKIIELIITSFPSLNNNFFINEGGINTLINELILSSFDTTITKLFFLDKSNKLLSQDKAKQILSFLMIFALTKTGLLHFCLGRNFRRILKVLSLFPNVASEYLSLIFKGIYLNDIPIKSHKKIPKIKDELLAYVSKITIKQLEDSKEYLKIISMIIFTMKILKYLSFTMEINELIVIQEQLSKRIIHIQLINADNFNLLIPLYIIYTKERDNEMTSALQNAKATYSFQASLLSTTDKFDKLINLTPIIKYHELYKEKFEIFEIMNIQEYELWKPERITKIKLNESFLFNYLEYITLSTFYIQKTVSSFAFLQNVFQLDFIKYILNKRYIKLKYRRITLAFLRILYLSDHLYHNDNTIKINKYPNSEEYFNIKAQESSMQIISEDMKEKSMEITSFKAVIEIFIQEISLLPHIIIDQRDNPTTILSHLQELLASIKSIGDIFITYDITSHATLWFYELVSKFLNKSSLIINILHHLMSSSITTQVIDDKLLSSWISNDNNDKDIHTSFNSKSFNIYNKEHIYHVLFNELQSLYNQTNFNSDFNLGKFLKTYKEVNDMEFKVFSSINTSEQEYNSLIASFNDEYKQPKEFDPTTIVNTDEDIMIIIRKFKKYQECQSLYLNQFASLKNISFIKVMLNKSNDITIEFNYIFIEYLISILSYINSIHNINLTNLFIIINKILYENYEKTQQCIQGIVTKKNAIYRKLNPTMTKTFDVILFEELTKVLERNISLQIIISKSVIGFNRFNEICLLTKNMIQFYQLLGEGHNKSFQNLIVNGKKSNIGLPTQRNRKDKVNSIESSDNREGGRKVGFASDRLQTQDNQLELSKSIFTVLFNSLNAILHLVNIIPSIEDSSMGELPYDKLLLLIINIIDCVVEFFQGTTKDGYYDMYQKLIICLGRISNVVKLKLPTKAHLRLKYLIILKSNLLELICSILEEGTGDDPDLNALKDVMIVLKPIELYSEVVETFQLIYKEYLSNGNVMYTLKDRQLKEALVELYKFNQSFQLSIELRLAMKIFYLLKILSEVYNRAEVIEFFKELEPLYVQAERLEKINIMPQNNHQYHRQFAIKLYSNESSINLVSNNNNNNSMSLNGISSTILPINKTNKQHDNLNVNLNLNLHLNPEAPIQENNNIKALYKPFPNDRKQKEIEDQSNLISTSKMNYVIYSFLTELTIRIQIRNVENESTRDFSFFLVPPICFFLSKWTKILFSETVDRDTVATKILTLIDETDYFIFEMYYNKKNMKSFNSISRYLFNINMMHFQYINFILLFAHNISFLIHMFSWQPIPDALKEIVFVDNYILCSIHLLFIIIILIIWFLYKLELKYKHHVMQFYKERFIFRKFNDSQVEGQNEGSIGESQCNKFNYGSEDELLKSIGSKLTFGQRLYVLLCSVVLNNEVNMFIFTLFFIVLFMIFGNGLCIAMPLLFIANLNNILFGIVYSLRLRWKQLIIVLIYAYLIVYIFSWFAFYYFSKLFEWDELYDPNQDNHKATEQLCSSMIQCYLTMLNYGVRNGGGIGDVIQKLSYKSNPGYYIAGFFFVVLFHIIVIWMMANLFFGIIVDTFADLREKTYRIEEDKTNICYICQISRDSAISKNINFDTHVQTLHSMWNYVYFLTFLHINNEKNFKSLETFVWDKIPKADTSWIPIREDNDINKN